MAARDRHSAYRHSTALLLNSRLPDFSNVRVVAQGLIDVGRFWNTAHHIPPAEDLPENELKADTLMAGWLSSRQDVQVKWP